MRRGTFVIICLSAIIFAYPYLKSYFFTPAPKVVQADAELLAALRQLKPDTGRYTTNQPYNNFTQNNKPWENRPEATGSLFYFDPNTISVAQWQKLGVKEKTAIGIQNYLAKGGRFRKADDIKKIWGIPPYLQEKLLPFVAIDEALMARQNSYANQPQPNYPERKPYEPKKILSININSADSAAFESLPGIGPGYAGRITRFRNRLGGFVSIDQIAETYGLPDSVFQKVKPFLIAADAGSIKKININTASYEELSAHPYIRWQLAKPIIAYRSQHGNFSTVDKLGNIMIITPAALAKMRPYLTTD